MKILFDARYTRFDQHDGISRYSVELAKALAKLQPITLLIFDDRQKKWFEGTPNIDFLTIHSPTSPKEPFSALLLNKYQPDVVYSPMQTIGTTGRKYVAVLTIHDTIYYRHPSAPQNLPLPVRWGWWVYHQTYLPQRVLLRGADIVTSVSITSAREIAAAKMTKKPVTVVYNAPQKFNARPLFKEQVTNLVYMGSFMKYKNVETLLKAMDHLPGRTLHLLSRIAPERKEELSTLIPADSQVIFYNGVTDEQYAEILADNAALVTASLDEGFGIPVAEAMAAGVPVIISNTNIFHEVAGNGASYFEAQNPKELASRVVALDNQQIRDAQINAALKHVAQFDWNLSAKKLYEAMKQATKRPR